MIDRNPEIAEDQRITFRIGINLGDIIVDDDDIFGDGVNVAARLEALAEPGGICISRVVRDQIGDKLSYAFEEWGSRASRTSRGRCALAEMPLPLVVVRVQPSPAAHMARARGPAVPLPSRGAAHGGRGRMRLVAGTGSGRRVPNPPARAGTAAKPAPPLIDRRLAVREPVE